MDCDAAGLHGIAGPFAGVAIYNYAAAFHIIASKTAGVAVDCDAAGLHGQTSRITGVAIYNYAAVFHETASPSAGVAVDCDAAGMHVVAGITAHASFDYQVATWEVIAQKIHFNTCKIQNYHVCFLDYFVDCRGDEDSY